MLVKSTPICFNEVLRYVVMGFGCIVHLTVHIPSLRILDAETGSNVLDNAIEDVGVVVFSLMLAGFPVRVGMLLTTFLLFVGQFIIVATP